VPARSEADKTMLVVPSQRFVKVVTVFTIVAPGRPVAVEPATPKTGGMVSPAEPLTAKMETTRVETPLV